MGAGQEARELARIRKFEGGALASPAEAAESITLRHLRTILIVQGSREVDH
jgi:hypothetical protein